MSVNAAVSRIMEAVAPGAALDTLVLDELLAKRPECEALVPYLASRQAETVRAAVVYLGMYGSMRECSLLALCLQHPDAAVAQLAEYCLWSIWMRAGSEEGNRRLAEGIESLKLGALEDAVRTLGALVALEPAFAEARFQYGLALSSVDRTDEAVRAFRHTLRLNPHHFGAAAALGHAYVALGNLRAALYCYRQALRIHPRLEDIPAAIAALEALVGKRAEGT